MTALKITYIICSLVSDLALLAGAILTPIYATPGYYWWSALLIIFMIASSVGFTERLNGWKEIGFIDT